MPWKNDFANHRSHEFKELALDVKNKLREILSWQQGISNIKIENFKQKHGNTSCVFECKMSSSVVERDDIKNVLNGTVDIGVIAPVAPYTEINMSLELSNVSWIASYSNRESKEYKNLTSRIKVALEDVYQNTDDLVGFEINSLSRTSDGSVMVDYLVKVYPDSELNKKYLESIFNEFTKNNSFGGMIAGKKPGKKPEKEENDSEVKSEPNGTVTGLVVMGALIMCVAIIAFLVRVSVKIINDIAYWAMFSSCAV